MATRRVAKADGLRRNASGMVMAGAYSAKFIDCSPVPNLGENEVVEMWVVFQNVGTQSWDINTKLATDYPRDRASSYYHPSWINSARICSVNTIVRPGETYKFIFTIKSSSISYNTLSEKFSLVQEGLTWFDRTPESSWELVITPKFIPQKTKILYMSCHETLEHSELTLLSRLGFDVFPVGIYSIPQPLNPTREGGFQVNKELQEKFMRYFGKTYKPGAPVKLNEDFVKHFDIIINCHWMDNFTLNLPFFKNKKVIWRTIGLSNASPEQKVAQLKSQMDLKIIRMTPGEPSTAGQDALIRSHIDPDYFNGWIGDEEYVLTIQKWTRLGEIGRLANEYQEITKGLQRKLCGRDNRGFDDCSIDNPSSAQLLEFRRRARVYLSLATKNATNTYTFFEAMMTGMPVVSVGPKLAQTPWFENPKWIEHGVSGFVSDDVKELRYYVELLLKDYELAKKMGENARKSVIDVFSPNTIIEEWKRFFQTIYGINM